MRRGDAAIRPGLDDQPLSFIPRLDHPGHGDESFPQGIEGQDLWGNPSLSGQFVESGFQLRGKCDHHLDLSENDRPRGKDDETQLALSAFQGVTNWNSPQLLSQQALIRGGES